MDEYLYRLCEEIDAAVFSGDRLYDRQTFKGFTYYLKRWTRENINIETIITEMEAEDDQNN